MKKIICDVCGEPINNSESWGLNLKFNFSKSNDFEHIEQCYEVEDLCKSCSINIIFCIEMLKRNYFPKFPTCEDEGNYVLDSIIEDWR